VVKNIGKFCLKTLKFEIEKEKEKIEKLLSQLEERYPDDIKKPIPDYSVNKGAIKAVELLNEKIYSKIFYNNSITTDDVKLIYRIYFQLMDIPEICRITDNREFWAKSCNYLVKNGDTSIGRIV
jgi:hypothetical protein